MLRIIILVAALCLLRPFLVGRRYGAYKKDSPYGHTLDGVLSPAQVSALLDDHEGLKVASTEHRLAL